MDTTGLTIHMFDIITIGGIGETEDVTWSVLQQVPLSSSVYTITEDMLLEYDWEHQTIAIPNQWGAKSLDAPSFMWSGEGAFLVSFNGQRLFGGRIVQSGSPRRFDFPAMALTITSVMNQSDSKGKLLYSFHPTSSVQYEPQAEFLADDPAMAEQVHQHLVQIGKLK